MGGLRRWPWSGRDKWFLFAGLSAALVGCNKVGFSPVEQKSLSCEERGDCATNGSGAPLQERSFVVQGTNKVDILFVVDSSISMATERQELGSKLSAFVSQLQGLDWRLCVNTTDPLMDGKFLKFGNGSYYLTPETPSASALFLNRVTSINNGSGDEQGIGAIFFALDHLEYDCIREHAALSTIVLSDEDERSAGGYDIYRNEHLSFQELRPWNYPESVVEKVETMWEGEKPFVAHSIVVPSGNQACYEEQSEAAPTWYGTRYEQLSRLTGGIIGNICADDYSSQLVDFAKRIQDSLSFVTLDCESESALDVVVSPRPMNLRTRVAANKVYFEPAIPAGTSVTLRYRCLTREMN